MERYEYQPLDTAKGEIRLVRILPPTISLSAGNENPLEKPGTSDPNVPVCCTISHGPHDDCPSYESLSYSWGNPNDTRAIDLNGKRVWVTKNLESALRELQRTIKQPRYFWIDALCINQNDSAEKSFQVRKMGNIFSNALNVVIWLGSEETDSRIAFNAIRRLSNPKLWREYRAYMRTVKKTKQSTPDDSHTEEQPKASVEAEQELLARIDSALDSDGHGVNIKAIKGLINRSPWFERVWVLQEVAMSKNAIVICGSEVIRWRDIDRAHRLLYVLRRHRLDHQDIETLKFIENRLWLLCTVWFDLNHYQQRKPLDYLLRNVSRMKATDPRDLVYALLNLASDAEQLDIVADYSITVSEVYVNTATALIKQRGLELLSQRLSTEGSQRLPLPSWVPDWSLRIEIGWRLRNLGETQRLPVPVSPLDGISSLNILTLSGSTFDTLSQVGEMLPGDINQNTSHIEKLSIVSSWLKDFTVLLPNGTKLVRPYEAPNAISNALWLTPVGGCNYGYDWKYKPALEADSHDYLLLTSHETNIDNQNRHISGTLPPSSRYLHSIISIARGRRMFVTSRGYIGLGPPNAVPGDRISIFSGDIVPFIIRQKPSGRFRLIGEAYVHGMPPIRDTSREMGDRKLEID